MRGKVGVVRVVLGRARGGAAGGVLRVWWQRRRLELAGRGRTPMGDGLERVSLRQGSATASMGEQERWRWPRPVERDERERGREKKK